MATRGAKPKPTALRVIEGNAGKRPLPEDEPDPGGRPSKPNKLRKRESELWDEFIETAFWLSAHDGPKAHMWVCMQAEFERGPSKMIAGRIAQLRALGSELGLDPASRTRLGGNGKKKKDGDGGYFD